MRHSVFTRAAGFAIALVLPLMAAAPEAEAVSLPMKYSNGKICRAGILHPHMHAGNSAHVDKTAAQMKAIRDWSSFTSLEYGRRWGHWALAMRHSVKCEHDKDAGVWRCRAEAQPCRS